MPTKLVLWVMTCAVLPSLGCGDKAAAPNQPPTQAKAAEVSNPAQNKAAETAKPTPPPTAVAVQPEPTPKPDLPEDLEAYCDAAISLCDAVLQDSVTDLEAFDKKKQKIFALSGELAKNQKIELIQAGNIANFYLERISSSFTSAHQHPEKDPEYVKLMGAAKTEAESTKQKLLTMKQGKWADVR